MRITASTAFVFLFSCSFCYSQFPVFTSYSVNEGLPQSSVSSILQDSKGYLWLGTQGGLCRYDGKNFITFTSDNGLPDNNIRDIIEDEAGNLWFGTPKGISVYDGKKFTAAENKFPVLASGEIFSLYKDPSRKIWLGTNHGVYCINGETISSVTGTEKYPVYSIFTDSKENSWFGTATEGLMMMKKSSPPVFFGKEKGMSVTSVHAITEDQSGNLWIGTNKGLYKYDGEKFTNVLEKDVRAIMEDSNHNLWAGTMVSGLYVFNGSKWTQYFTETIKGDGVFSMLEDREKNLWFGSDGVGALKKIISPFTRLTEENGLHSNVIFFLAEDNKNNLWMGTQNGTGMFDGSSFHKFNKQNGFTDERVGAIMQDKNGNIWLGYYGSGLFIYNPQKKSIFRYDEKKGLSSNLIRAIYEDSKGNIWIGCRSEGLNKIKVDRNSVPVENKIYRQSDGLGSDGVIAIMEDHQGALWFATMGRGLSKLQDEKFSTYNTINGLISNNAACITEDEYGSIWCSTISGISIINDKEQKIRNLTEKDGLSSGTVYTVIADKQGNLFAGTNRGIDKINLEEYYKNGKIILKHFGKEENFTGIECNSNAAVKEKDGSIWFGTIMGAIKYDPRFDVINTVEPATHITGIKLFFENVPWEKYKNDNGDTANISLGIILPYNQNHLTFDFIGVSLTVPEKVLYSFKLEGFDKEWSPPAKSVSATYSYLPAGHYNFMVKAMNNDGLWNKNPASFSFIITPPFWKTWWFNLSALLLLIAGVYSFFKIRLRNLRLRALELQQQVDLKTKELREEKSTVEEQKKIIEKKNQNITASIHYAQRIQNTILPLKETIGKALPHSFIFFKPKDIVSGDFYWFHRTKDLKSVIIAAVDCTGHGVPGAFMSLIGNELLKDIVINRNITNPSEILYKMHDGIVVALKKNELHSGTVDGMDVSLCCIDTENGKLEFASSGQPMMLIRNGNIESVRSGKFPIGLVLKKERRYDTRTFTLAQNDCFYLYTDGYCDQFGGDEGEKFMEARFRKLLLDIHRQDMPAQEKLLEKNFEDWKSNRLQLDDVLVIGIKF